MTCAPTMGAGRSSRLVPWIALLLAAPVPAGARTDSAAPPVVQPFVHPQESTRVEYYDVNGATVEELRAQIRAKGVEGWAAATWTRVKYELTVREGPAGCRIESVNAAFDARIRMPRWANRRAAPEAEQRAWDAWLPVLRRHEEGHVRIAREAAARVERAVWDTPGGSTCEDLTARARARADAVLADLRRRQRDYDLRTDHGRKQ